MLFLWKINKNILVSVYEKLQKKINPTLKKSKPKKLGPKTFQVY